MNDAVKKLYEDAGVPLGTPGSIELLPNFERALNHRVKVVSQIHMTTVVYKGLETLPQEGVIYLYFCRENEDDKVGHYTLVTNIKGFLGYYYYCIRCDHGFWHRNQHRCPDISNWCYTCFSPSCQDVDGDKTCGTTCDTCGTRFRSATCCNIHNTCREMLCISQVRCPKCKRTFQRPSGTSFKDIQRNIFLNHDCLKHECHVCKEVVSDDHKCFVPKKPFAPKENRYIFFDIETDQSSGQHKPNFIHMKWFVPECTADDDDEYNNKKKKKKKRGKKGGKPGRQGSSRIFEDSEEEDDNDTTLDDHTQWQGTWKEKSFAGMNSMTEFIDFLTSSGSLEENRQQGRPDNNPVFYEYTAIAHNFKGFDGVLVLRHFLLSGLIPKVVANGLKIISLTIPIINLRFVDSFNFLPMGLAKLPEAFGLDCGSKGYFPHFFNTPENWDYVGNGLPDQKYYGPEFMDTKARRAFTQWHEEENSKQLPYNFQEQLAMYCRQDVEILAQGCLAYRKIMCTETGCDPFRYVTCASVCAAVYQHNFMPEKTIGTVPPGGNKDAKFSNEALEYLEYLKLFGDVPDMQHAGNTGEEKKIGPYAVDGYSPDQKKVYEYYGCFYHGCPKCYSNLNEISSRDLRIRLELAHLQTVRREKELRETYGMDVEIMWGCEWKEMKETQPEILENLKKVDIDMFLYPKEAFFGGRTEAFKLSCFTSENNGEEGMEMGPMAYDDIISLYPHTMWNYDYPIKHGKLITQDFGSLDEYFGIVKVSILPPKNLYLPVLPMHCGKHKKLLFPLCAACAANFSVEPCTHSDKERVMRGTWFSEEIQLALEHGYELVKIHSVLHFEERSQELFKGYIQCFYKKKLLSSKVNFKTDTEFDNYIREVKIREGIELSRGEFHENPGLRSLTKLMLNNLWGRYGMRLNLPQTEFTTEFARILLLDNDPTWEITGVNVVSENIAQLNYKRVSDEFIPMRDDTNIFIAVATTAWARIRLYRELTKLKNRAIYCDTDSIIYEESKNPTENLSRGNFLGDMSSELKENDPIVNFVSSGPKSYSFICQSGSATVKLKGFTMNSENAPVLCFRNMKRIILNGVHNADEIIEEEEYVREGELKRKWKISEKERQKNNKLRRVELFTVHQAISGTGWMTSAIAKDDVISTYNGVKIHRTRDWDLIQRKEQKLYSFCFDKRIVLENFDTVPYGYHES